ncbi:alpha-mannosidase [Caldanaerobius fijiensis DSM 17918]|uniref:Alpha-mannosidase n=1 Tax=Caldanaerobius fijiensis DSM 17918 TaxID=1121256 RepID=A0A1M4TBH1_9THEO|nr:alpha-mannosidase [Caldanaerobius fijiensis]SHE41882.1 alpha-mannosidase [Caldanaerobius fijiensis DSM 17918]
MDISLESVSKYLSTLEGTVGDIEKDLKRFFYEIKFVQKLIEAYPEKEGQWAAQVQDAVEGLKEDIEKGLRIKDAVAKAEDSLKAIAAVAKEFTIHYIGHAHIDMNWLWPWQETVDTCYKTFNTADKLMSEYPDFKFSQSQTSVYKAMEDYSPETYEMIHRRVKSGQWEITANTWVEGDKNMASGEALVRQILYTKRYFKEKFGLPYDAIKIDWEPDTFGHAWTYPQILAKAGIKRYYFCRAGKGHRLFLWQAPDGSKVLAWNDEKLWYLGAVRPEDVVEAVDHYKATGMKDYMIVYGVGDHGGGPTRRHINMIKEMEKWPVFPKVKFSTTDEYFTIAERYIDKLPVVDGELNFTFRGCYTSQSNIKKANRFSENMLGQAEAYALVANKLVSKAYPEKQLHKGWINTMFNQFHDILPGSGIHATYEYSQGLYQDTKAHVDMIKEASFKAIVSKLNTKGKGDLSITVFNPLAWTRTDTVTVNVYEKFDRDARFILVDNTGKEIPVQYTFKSWFGFDFHVVTFTAKDVPGCGYKTYYLKKTYLMPEESGATVSFDGANEKVIENEYLKLRVEAGSGTIVSLIDKKTNVEYVPHGKKLGLLQVLHEAPNDMSAWVIGQILETTDLDKGAHIEIVERGPVKATVRVSRKYNKSEITMDITLCKDMPRVDFKLDINWLEIGDKVNGGPLLKVAFPLNACDISPTYEIPFGSIKRNEKVDVASLSASPNNMSSLNVKGEDVPAQKWVDITGKDDKGNRIGLCVVNNSKYGFDYIEDTIRMSLIRSTFNPDPLPELGKHEIEFAVYPHSGQWRNADSARCGYEFNNRLEAHYDDPHDGTLSDAMAVIEVMPENIIPAAVKKAEDDDSIVIRMYEVDGIETAADIKVLLPAVEAVETDLLEQPIGNAVKIQGGIFSTVFKPYEIKTFKIR